jgi:hypothetical protein
MKTHTGFATIKTAELMDLISSAIKAPSGHNTQPWKFRISENSITIFPDYSRTLPVVDADNHALFISIGCALENLEIAARHFGFDPDAHFELNEDKNEKIIVRLSQSISKAPNYLFNSINIRQSTRNKYNGQPISQADIDKIKSAALQEDVDCLLITEKEEIEPLVDLVKQAAALQIRNKAFLKELTHWIRFNKPSGEKTADGLYAAATGNPSVPKWFGKIILNFSMNPKGEAKKHADLINSSSGLMLFIARRNDKKAWVNVGRSFERVALTATSLNINHAHENMPCEEVTIRQKLKAHLQLKDAEQPLLLIRLGYSEKMPYSFRRSLEDVIT